MTLQELNEHARLRRELTQAEDLKASLTEAVDLRAQVLTGLPHAPGSRDKLGELIPGILDAMPSIDAKIENLQDQITKQEAEIIQFVDSIPDIQVRTFFRLRFLGGFEWSVVAAVVGGKNNAASVKTTCYRYLRKAKVVP